MPLTDLLQTRIHLREIRQIISQCHDDENSNVKNELLDLIISPDPRTAYNALWVITHIPRNEQAWLIPHRNTLIDALLTESHTGKRRLLLTILAQLPLPDTNPRVDFLDYCLSKINSTEPYAIRALALKQAHAMCRNYPDLMRELLIEIAMMNQSSLSPGLKSALRNILKNISS